MLGFARVGPTENRLLLWQQDKSVMWMLFLVILDVNMFGLVEYLIGGKLWNLFMEGYEQDLVGFLLLLVNSQVLATVKGTLVPVQDGHPTDLIEWKVD